MCSCIKQRITTLHLPFLQEMSVYLLDTRNIQAEEVAYSKDLLKQEQLEEIEGIESQQQRPKAILVQATLRRILGKATGKGPDRLEIARDKYNKPYIKHSHLKFNMSYGNGYVLIAYHPCREVGVDIELVQKDIDFKAMFRVFMTCQELHNVECLASESDWFFMVWSAKEAYLKALGTGFLIEPIPQFISVREPIEGVLHFEFERGSATAYRGFVDGHVLAVCLN
jgi:phosphopantetheinyl transferase